MNWAKADNNLIKDLNRLYRHLFPETCLTEVLLHYSVFDSSNTLLVMRPYQIAATERIMWKIKSAYQAKFGTPPKAADIYGTLQDQVKLD